MAVLSNIEIAISQRVIECFEALEYSKKKAGKTDFAELLSVSKANLSKYFSLDRPFPIESIVNLATKENISTNWLLTGEGEMFISAVEKEINIAENQQLTENEWNVIKRIIEVVNNVTQNSHITAKEFCKRVGLNYSNLIFNVAKVRITVDQLINISDIFLIDLTWLLTGKGDMLSEDYPRLEKSLDKLEILTEHFHFFKNVKEKLTRRLNRLDFDSKNSKNEFVKYYNYFQQAKIEKLVEISHKPIKDLSSTDLNIIGLERSFEDQEFTNLYFTKDFDDARKYFNKVNDRFELRGFEWPEREDFATDEEYMIAVNEANKPSLDDETTFKWRKYKLAKQKDLLTTEELMTEAFRWKFRFTAPGSLGLI